jgi:peptidoglycan/xylan/chitin deacetylase (PgdA/CDA1 family)
MRLFLICIFWERFVNNRLACDFCAISIKYALRLCAFLALGLTSAHAYTCPLTKDCFSRAQLEGTSEKLSFESVSWQTVSSGAKAPAWVSPKINVREGQYFRFENQYKSDTVSELQLHFGGAELPSNKVLVPLSGDSGDWQKFSYTFSIPPGVKELSVGQVLTRPGKLLIERPILRRILGPEFKRGIVSITFDDGWKSALRNAVPILEAAVSDTHPNGLRTTQYIITKGSLLQPDKYRRYLTPKDVLSLYKNGHDIASHTRSHADLVREIGDEEGLEGEIGGSYEDFIRHQLPAPLSIAYPYGRHDDEVMRVAASHYFAARGVSRGMNFADSNPYSLRTQLIQRNTTVSEIIGWIDDALANRAWLILSLHSVEPTIAECVHPDSNEPDEECTDVATVKALADYLKGTPRGTVMTVRDVLNDKLKGKGEVWPLVQPTSN